MLADSCCVSMLLHLSHFGPDREAVRLHACLFGCACASFAMAQMPELCFIEFSRCMRCLRTIEILALSSSRVCQGVRILMFWLMTLVSTGN